MIEFSSKLETYYFFGQRDRLLSSFGKSKQKYATSKKLLIRKLKQQKNGEHNKN